MSSSFKTLPIPYARHKIVCNSEGKPIDYMFVEVNAAFETQTGLQAKTILQKNITDIIPEFRYESFDWIGFYGEVALGKSKDKEIEQFSDHLQKWFKITVFSDEHGYFSTIFHDVSHEHMIVAISKNIHEWDKKSFDYEKLSQAVREISGAQYVSCNVFAPNGKEFTTVALSGIQKNIKKAMGILGIDLIGKTWAYDPHREQRIKDNKVTVYDSLADLTYSVFSKQVISFLQYTFKLGIVCIVKMQKDTEILGDFTLMFEKGKQLQNQNLIELIADMTGAAIQRIRAEEKILQQQEELQNFFNVNLDLLCIADLDGNFIKVNKEWEQLLGYSVEELERSKFLDYVHPDDMEATLENMKQLEADKPVIKFVNRYLCKDGSFRYIEWRSNPKGNIVYAAARDITDAVLHEQQLRESEEKKSSLIASMDDIIFVLNSELVIVEYYSSGISNLYIKPEEFINKSFDDIQFPEPAYGNIRHAILQCFETKKTQQVEYFLSIFGEENWFDMRITVLFDSQGEVFGVTCVARDITEKIKTEQKLRKSDELLQKLSAHIPGMIYQFRMMPDGKTSLPYVSENIFDVFELDPRKVKHNASPIFEVIHADDYNKVLSEITTSMQHLSEWNMDFRIILPNRGLRWVTGIASPERLEDNSVLWHGYIYDSTERKQQDERVRLVKEQYEFAISGTNDGIWDWNIITNELFLSRRWKEILGYEDDEISNDFSSFESLLHEDDKARVFTYIDDYFTDSITKYEIEFRMKHKDGSLRWILAKGEALRNEDGKPYRMAGSHSDISKRKSQEEDLLKLKAAMDQSPVTVVITDTQGTIEYVNPAFELKTGYSYDEAIGKNPRVLKTDNFPQEIYADLWHTILSGNQWKGEFLNKKKNGELFWESATISPIRDSQGQLTHFLAVKEDITEQKKAEEIITTERSRLRNFIEGTNLGTWEWNVQTGETIFNERWAEMVGYRLDELQPTNIETWMRFTHPDDLEKSNELLTAHFAGKTDFYECEARMIHRNGSHIWVLDRGRVITWTDDGKPLIMSGTHQDITDRKKVEKEIVYYSLMQDILIQISSTYINVDLSDIDTVINNSLEKIGLFVGADRAYVFDFDTETQTTTNTYEWCNDGISSEMHRNLNVPISHDSEWAELLMHGKEVYVPNVSEMPANDLKLLLESQSIKSLLNVPIISDSFMGFVGFDFVKEYHEYNEQEKTLLTVFAELLVNFKQRVLYAENLTQAKQQAEKANEAKSQFLANMSHEIRTPLNGVVGFTDLLLKTNLDTMQAEYAQNIRVAGQSLLGVINDVLDFSKIEAGKLELEIIEVDIVELLEEVIDIMKFHASQKNIELLLDIAPDIPNRAFFDPIRLKQILINLLSNAIKFTEEGEVVLKLTVSPVEHKKAVFNFAVQDTGIGIKKEYLNSLFTAFTQADSSTTRKYGGTGLGLAISQVLCEKMNSTLSVESEYGKGSVFSFSVDTLCSKKSKTKSKKLSVSKVLLVDDNSYNRQIIQRNCEYWGIQCDACSGGLEAIEMLQQNQNYDMAIIDYHMPEVDGLETIHIIRKKLQYGPDVLPIMFLHSSSEDKKIFTELERLGVTYNLQKPLKATDLLLYFQNAKHAKNTRVSQYLASQNEEVQMQVLAPVSILVAEDVEINRYMVKTMIWQLFPNARIYDAENGLEAVEIYKEQQPDIILMDIQMPLLDGIKAAKQIREIEQETSTRIPIITLTAHALAEEQEICKQAGMDDFLTKPIDLDLLYEVLKKWLITDVTDEELISVISEKHYAHINDSHQIRYSEGLRRVGDNEVVYKKMLLDFSHNYANSFTKLQELFEANDFKKLSEYAHTIKGLAGNLGCVNLAKFADEIQHETSKPHVSYEVLKNHIFSYQIVSELVFADIEVYTGTLHDEADISEIIFFQELAGLLSEDEMAAHEYFFEHITAISKDTLFDLIPLTRAFEVYDFSLAKTEIDTLITLKQ